MALGSWLSQMITTMMNISGVSWTNPSAAVLPPERPPLLCNNIESINHEFTLDLKQKLQLADCTYLPPGCDVSSEITKGDVKALRRRKMRVVPLQALWRGRVTRAVLIKQKQLAVHMQAAVRGRLARARAADLAEQCLREGQGAALRLRGGGPKRGRDMSDSDDSEEDDSAPKKVAAVKAAQTKATAVTGAVSQQTYSLTLVVATVSPSLSPSFHSHAWFSWWVRTGIIEPASSRCSSCQHPTPQSQ